MKFTFLLFYDLKIKKTSFMCTAYRYKRYIHKSEIRINNILFLHGEFSGIEIFRMRMENRMYNLMQERAHKNTDRDIETERERESKKNFPLNIC